MIVFTTSEPQYLTNYSRRVHVNFSVKLLKDFLLALKRMVCIPEPGAEGTNIRLGLLHSYLNTAYLYYFQFVTFVCLE